MTIFGIDVDQGRGVIDWPKVAASGVKFAIIRCVREGDLGVDTAYARNVAGARANALKPGAYAFLSGGGRAAKQAALFIATVGDPTGMFIVCDVESGALTPTAADVRTFQAALRAAWPNHPLLTYGSRGSTLGGLGTLADLGPLWLGDYGMNATGSPAAVYAGRGGAAAAQWHSTFGGWTHPDIWQFGSKGVVPGIAGSVDIDAIETADLAALTGSTGATPMHSFTTKPIGSAHFDAVPGHCCVTLDGSPWDGGWRVGTNWVIYGEITLTPPLPGGLAGADRASALLVMPTTKHDGTPWPAAKPACILRMDTDWPAGKTAVAPPPVAPPPPDTSPFTQADMDKAKADVKAKAIAAVSGI
jgi:GH25 family lysozyme M1 (1,4-beta-N-acetylmuramidase)